MVSFLPLGSCVGIWQLAKANLPLSLVLNMKLSSTHFLKLPCENQCLVAVLGLQVPDGWSCLSVSLQKVFVEPPDSSGLSCWLTPVKLLLNYLPYFGSNVEMSISSLDY